MIASLAPQSIAARSSAPESFAPQAAITRIVAIALAALTLGGCGYAHRGVYPDNIASVGVPIFDNRTPYREFEFDLTEALIKEIELRTPYKVVHPSKAQTIVQGVLTNVNQRVLSQRSVGGVPEEVEVTMVVNFEWKNTQTAEILRDRKGLPATARHVPTRPLGEPFEVAQHRIVEIMAQRIVDAMRKDW